MPIARRRFREVVRIYSLAAFTFDVAGERDDKDPFRWKTLSFYSPAASSLYKKCT